MRLIFATLAAVTAFLTVQSAVAGQSMNPALQSDPTKVTATFSKIYIPVGFDSNDHFQFVGEGTFNNSCYRPAPTDVTVDKAKKTIKVGPAAYQYNGICLQVILPFERVVDVGILGAGTWQIVNATDGKQLGQISIKPALTADPDDYLYAPIAQAYVRQQGSAETLILNGTFPSACMSMQDVKINVTNDVVVVQPIAQMDTSGKCAGTPTPFTQTVNLPALKPGRYLLHVRSMNANAVNTLFEIQ